MLVDDQSEVRSMVRIALRVADAADVVAEAATSTAATRLAEQHRPDVVVLDLLLPDATGRDAFRSVRAASPDSGLVIFSISDSDRGWYERRGAAYVPKNAGTIRLVETIRTLRQQ